MVGPRIQKKRKSVSLEHACKLGSVVFSCLHRPSSFRQSMLCYHSALLAFHTSFQ